MLDHPSVDPNPRKDATVDDADTITMFRFTDPNDGTIITMHWDRLMVRFVLGIKCGLIKGSPMKTYGLPASQFLKGINVTAEEVRTVAQEIEDDRSWPHLSTDELIIEGMNRIDFTGKTVLDIGGYDGRAGRMALLRGAKRAVCLDNQQWKQYGWVEPEHFEGVEYVKGDFRRWHEKFDVVLLNNVIYHLENPFKALKHLRTITGSELLICTLGVWSDLPVWRPYEPREVNPEDTTVYWGPSPAGLRKALKIAGFLHSEEVGRSHERMVYLARDE